MAQKPLKIYLITISQYNPETESRRKMIAQIAHFDVGDLNFAIISPHIPFGGYHGSKTLRDLPQENKPLYIENGKSYKSHV